MSEISKRVEKAEKLFQKGKHDLALQEYLAILHDEPSNDKIRQTAADLCVSLNRTQQAAELLGPLFERQAAIGDSAKAIITFKKLARLTTPSFEASFRYAQLVEHSHRRDALEHYEAALAGFVSAGRNAEATASMERIVALDPTIVNHVRQGDLASSVGDRRGAAAAFFRAGGLELKAGGDGLTKFERAYTLDPSNPEAAVAYARALLGRGNAAKVVAVLTPVIAGAGAPRQDVRELYGRALLSTNHPIEAEPFIWELFQRDPRQLPDLMRVMGALLDAREQERAIALSRKAEAHELRAGRRREYVLAVRDLAERHPSGIAFLEYLVELYNNASREQEYCTTLMKLFELYYTAGNFAKAGEALDRAAEVDPYEAGHVARLERLRGKIDVPTFNSIAHRFVTVGAAAEEEKPRVSEAEEQPNILEDFMLQAEIFLQYSMRSKAVERLERVSKLFPYEEDKNPRLRQLYSAAGFLPNYQGVPRPTGGVAAAAEPAAAVPSGRAATLRPVVGDENAVDNLARVTEITRSIYRQTNVKSVLFTTVNAVGRHWDVSRCIAGLCSPGKPPSAALEYCAPNVKQSAVTSIVKLITTLLSLIKDNAALVIPNVAEVPELAPIQELLTSGDVQALLVVPLVDGEQLIGLMILEQCGRIRRWRTMDVEVLKTIADQVVQAFLNARLRNLVKTLAVTEEKSGLLKRASYIDVLLSEIRRAEQQRSTCTVMLFNFGKPATLLKEAGETGVDSLMQQLGQVVCSHLRQTDIAIRYDLTTIAVILSDTAEKNSFAVVEKMRRIMAPIKVPGSDRAVTAAVGIAEAAMQPGFDPVDIATDVINRVEAALAIAHTEGGNRAHALPPNLESAAVA